MMNALIPQRTQVSWVNIKSETNTLPFPKQFSKECVAVLTMLYSYIRKMVQFHVLDLIFSLTLHVTFYTVECRKVTVVPRYPVGLDLVMGKYQ